MENSKRGSSSVFITIIMASIIAIVFTLITAARGEYIASRADAVTDIAADSVMSEFDYYIQKEYGLFLLGGKGSYLSGRLRSYVDYGMDGMKGVSVSSVKVSGEGYSVSNIELIRNQIIEHMEYAKGAGAIIEMKKKSENVNDMKYETLRNGKAIVSLPTYGMQSPSLTSIAEGIVNKSGDLTHVLQDGTEGNLMNKYIMSKFNNMIYAQNKEHFFRNEAEYILGGKLSDEENKKRVEMAIEAMRFPLNLEYLYTDKEKMEALLAAAEILTPEAAPVTSHVMAAAWAYAESDNDVKLLEEGHKVPVIKDKSSWAIDLDGVIDGLKTGVVMPDKENGMEYTDYIQFLMFFQDETVKVARIMDLIQINTRMNYDGEFVILEHCTGIHLNVRINGRQTGYEKRY